VENIYRHCREDMHMSLDDSKQEVARWRHLWWLSEDGNPQTLAETLDYTNCKIVPRNLCSHEDPSDLSCVNLRRRT